MTKVTDWSGDDVLRWLSDQGLQEYCDSLRNRNGQALLNLSQSDFTAPPLCLVTSDGGKQLLERIETLRIKQHIQNGHTPGTNGLANGLPAATAASGISELNGGTTRGHLPQKNGVRNGSHHQSWNSDCDSDLAVRIQIPAPPTGRPEDFPEEWTKTGVAFVYGMACFLATTVMISVVHERVPPMEATPPLPDKFFDWFSRREWAFTVCEVIALLLLATWLLQWSLLRHRSIVARRFFFLAGTLYLYRCVTMYVTTLPVPGRHFSCAPKVLGDHLLQVRRVVKMLAGGGLTLTGSHHLCGDYLYSGHTVMLTLTQLFITEYCPRRLCGLRWLFWCLWALGLFCILLAHDHYSIDVLVAYYITTRLFWCYHTMANQPELKQSCPSSFLSRLWWFSFFLYLESGVHGVVPPHYRRPFPWKQLLQGRQHAYSRLESERHGRTNQ
ncbi:phosphatidylcholine:ceramide cholinephosphotransferase 1-like [Myripristis murdjan]|uniref:Phosphatidylcholine:ceramide cholinephosphotransferase 1 n=1 Tax=Myripristis murdjan TaxID=586833 RepID=A0A667YUJ9_9TELE|nr:phosphatidylcholine:ceramide cholinephosphotransferase 1-like [Myripristis murdjan]